MCFCLRTNGRRESRCCWILKSKEIFMDSCQHSSTWISTENGIFHICRFLFIRITWRNVNYRLLKNCQLMFFFWFSMIFHNVTFLLVNSLENLKPQWSIINDNIQTKFPRLFIKKQLANLNNWTLSSEEIWRQSPKSSPVSIRFNPHVPETRLLNLDYIIVIISTLQHQFQNETLRNFPIASEIYCRVFN